MSTDNLDRWKSYFYPGTQVLINKEGLRDLESLKLFEGREAAARSKDMPRTLLKGDLDLKTLQAIHEHMFHDVYEWAGQLRDVRMSKGKSGGFERPENFEAAAKTIHDQLVAADYFKGRNRANFVDGLTAHHSDLNKLHPFREGNGRATRVLLSAICTRAGYFLDQTRIDNHKGEWNQACAAAMTGDRKELKRFFTESIRPMRSLVFERWPEASALARFPELKPVYEKLAVVAETLAKHHPGNAKAQAHFMLQKRTDVIMQLDSGETKGLAMPEQAKPAMTRSEYALANAQEFANTSLKDPAAKALFMSEFRANLDKAPGVPPAKKREPERGR